MAELMRSLSIKLKKPEVCSSLAILMLDQADLSEVSANAQQFFQKMGKSMTDFSSQLKDKIQNAQLKPSPASPAAVFLYLFI